MRGSLQDLGLADILQLIFRTKKVGRLRLTNDYDEVWADIHRGWIIDADTEGRPSDAKLGSRLMRAGLLTNAELGLALKRRNETGAPIAEILTRAGYATPETITQYATLQVTDTVYEVFTWSDGQYQFDERPVVEPPLWIQPINGDQLLMHGIVLAAEWATIARRVPSGDWRVAHRHPLPPEQELTADALFTDPTATPMSEDDIGSNERLIHELAQVRTTVQTIIDRSPFHRLETCRCLSKLVGEGYLRLMAPRG
ncbi:MAG: DUF4388 domain-containing protein [Myxococcota bacterium]